MCVCVCLCVGGGVTAKAGTGRMEKSYLNEATLLLKWPQMLAVLVSGRAKCLFPIKILNKLFIFIIYTHLSKLLRRSRSHIHQIQDECIYIY